MAGRIRDEDVKLVRDSSPIADVIGEYLQLRNAGGGNLKGLCPFHDERTPSFQVTPSRGLFHCFGCGEGGDVITFLMHHEHLGFSEAVEQLAARAGIQLRYEQGGYTARGDRSQRARLLEAHQAAARFYQEALAGPEAARGRALLAERGFDDAAVASFGVGYAPGGWDVLVRHLRGRGFTDQELLTGGLASQGRRGPVDRFRDRLVWPIADITGEIIGFGARRLGDDPNSPKYLNTPETPLYKKSSVLYGLDRAKRRIAQGQRAVIVEGYTDVMACHLAGVEDAVATCGTAFGDEHINILRRLLADRNQFLNASIVFTFDGDAAGRRAALRAFEGEQKFLAQTYVAIEQHGMDPCELRMANGDAAVRELIASQQPLVDFVIESAIEPFDVDTTPGRIAALRALSPLLAKVKDRQSLDQHIRYAAKRIGDFDERLLRDEIRMARRGGQARQGGAERAPRPGRQDPVARAEREALKIALQLPVLAGPLFDELEVEEFTIQPYAGVRRAIAAAGGTGATAGGQPWLASVSEHAVDDVERALITELVVERLFTTTTEPDPSYVNRCLTEIRLRSVTRHIADLKGRLQRVNPVKDAESHLRLFGELTALEEYRHGLIGRL